MIVNGGSYRAVGWWTNHLQSKENDSAEVIKSYGLRAEDMHGMLEEMMDLAHGTKCQNPFYQMNLNPAPGERLSADSWDRARQIAEKHHGLEGQPYFVVEHVKHGRPHQHIVWSRIDLEKGRAISDSNDARKNHGIAREIEREFGLQKVIGPYDREPEMPRPPHAPKPWEMYRDKQHGLDTREITAHVTGLRQQSDTGNTFHLALGQNGYELVTGRRGLLILDSAGNEHSLARRCGLTAKELNAFMRGVDRAALPTVEQAKEHYQERKISELEADRATVRDQIQWQQALERAAIEKEERDRRFVEPENETRGGPSAAKEQEPQPGADIAGLLKHQLAEVDKLLYGGLTPDEQKRQLENLDKFLAAELYERQKKYPNHYRTHWQGQIPPGVAAEIEKLATAEAEREYARHDPAREDTAWQDAVARAAIAKEDRQREFVEPRPAPAEPARGEARGEQPENEQSKPAPAPTLKGAVAHLRDAFQHSDTPGAFILSLDEREIMLACTTRDEAHRSRAQASFARQFGNFAPEYREGEIVAVTFQGHVYKLSERNTGMNREDMEAFLEPLDRHRLQGIESTKEIQNRARQDRNEMHWPIMPQAPDRQTSATGLKTNDAPATSPALQFQNSARQTDQPEAAPAMPANLRGIAAEIWTAYNSRSVDRQWQRENADGTKETRRDPIAIKGGRDPLQFGQALDERGLILARATKEEAERSQKDAEHWKHHGEHRPVYREGEFVVIDRRGEAWKLTERTTGHSPKEVQAFLNKAEWKALPGIEAGRQTMKARADERLTDARDRAAHWEAIRLKNATRKRGGRGNGRTGKPAPPNLVRAADRAIGGVLGALGKLADGFSLDALTPKEKYEAAKRDAKNEREADTNADYAAYMAELAEQRRRDQQRQAEDRQRREPERER